VGRNTEGKGARKGDVMRLNEDMGMSGSALEPEGGKGYSKRGETSNGVPRIDDGECRDKSDKSRRGLSDIGLDETCSASKSDEVTAPTPSPVITGTRMPSSRSGSGVGLLRVSATTVMTAGCWKSPSSLSNETKVGGTVGIKRPVWVVQDALCVDLDSAGVIVDDVERPDDEE